MPDDNAPHDMFAPDTTAAPPAVDTTPPPADAAAPPHDMFAPETPAAASTPLSAGAQGEGQPDTQKNLTAPKPAVEAPHIPVLAEEKSAAEQYAEQQHA